MLSCKEVSELSSREQEVPLPFADKVGMHAHLMMCTSCRNFRRQIGVLRHAMRAYASGQAVETEPSGATGATNAGA